MDYDISYDNIMFLIDQDEEKQASGFVYIMEKDKKKVYSPEVIRNIDAGNYIWFVLVGKPSNVIEKLKEAGAKEIYCYPSEIFPSRDEKLLYTMEMYALENEYRHNLQLEDYKKKYTELIKGNRFVLPRMTVIMSTKCTYRCKNCINMIPYYRRQKDIASEQIIRDIDNVAACVDEWIFCELIGGEPFLYKDLMIVLQHVISMEKIRNILLITNGSIFPDEPLIRLLRNNKITVRVSDYGINKKVDEFVSILKNYEVRVDITKNMKWIMPGSAHKRYRTETQLKEQYNKCHAPKLCKTLYNSRIYACNRAMALHDLGYISSEQDWMEVKNEMEVNILDNFLKREWCLACDYCDLYSENFQYCVAGEQTNEIL